ncbi:MAG: hypothetical protein HZA88_13495 [Verrucomicrobia bacterium]|nr:hypothetical protein [Verrucomicrobiota bacterium]
MNRLLRTFVIAVAGSLLVFSATRADANWLWQIGKADGSNAEFALAPQNYDKFTDDGFFVVGHSDARKDWPYVHPGPSDGWAGGGAHTFTIVFGIAKPVASGTCRLRLDLLDTHYKSPPRLRIEVNETRFEHALPKGRQDGSIAGHPEKGQPYRAEVEFPATLLKAGRNDIAIVNDNGSWCLYDAVSLEAPAPLKLAPIANAAALVAKAHRPPARVEQVVVVFKTHFDIGYTDMASNVVHRYRTSMIDQALDVADQNRDLPPAQQFAWTLPGWPMHQILDWPEQTPERKARVEQALKDGRFVVHALPFTTHTELLELEDLVRGLGYSSRIARRLGLPLSRDAKMTDVPEHTWAMATLLHHAGVKFMHIGCNAMSYSPRVPPIYWWEGPDGSRVLTMYSPRYGTGLFPPRDWPYKTWLALLHTGDNHGPPRLDEVKRVLDQLDKKLPGVKVRIGRLSDFGDAILAEKAALPVVRGDTPDTWIHGPMSDPAGASQARWTRSGLAQTEALNTQLRAWGVGVTDAAPTVAAAYEQSLLYGEHTWGGSIGWIGGGRILSFGEEFLRDRATNRFARSEASWEEHSTYIRTAHNLVSTLTDGNLRALANAAGGSDKRVVVYNPLPWKRNGAVGVEWKGATIRALKPADGGEPVPVELREGRLEFVARDVPPMGYRVFVPTASAEARPPLTTDAPGEMIESPFFRATFDKARGVVRSLVDKRTGRELVDKDGVFGFGQFLYERFDTNQVMQYCHDYIKMPGRLHVDFYKPGMPSADQVPYRASSPQDFRLTFDETAFSVAARMVSASTTNGPVSSVCTSLHLYRDLPYADLRITLRDKRLEPWPEAGWLCLPFKVDAPQFRLGRLGSIIDPARDIVTGANRDLFGINTGVTIGNSRGRGAGFCSLDSPLVSLDRPGCWKFSLDFVPKKPVAFVNLFNNQWNTNFRLWNGGSWSYCVRIWATDNNDAEKSLITPSLEARYPLMAMAADGPAGKLPVMQRGLDLSRKGVQVTAFGDNPDGEGTVLRLWELAGKSGPCRVTLPAGFGVRNVQPVSLRGEPAGKPIAVRNGAFVVNLKMFAPANFVLQTSEKHQP